MNTTQYVIKNRKKGHLYIFLLFLFVAEIFTGFGYADQSLCESKIIDSVPAGDVAIKMTGLSASSFPEISMGCSIAISNVNASGLTKKDFTLFEDDKVVEDFTFSIQGLPLNIGLVLDTSGSVKPFLKDIKRGANLFIDSLKPEHQALLVEFSRDVILSQRLTYNKDSLKFAVDDIRASGGTKLYDGIHKGLSQLNGRHSILVVMTDGRDVKKKGDKQQYSDNTLDDVKKLALSKKIPVFSIGVGQDMDSEGMESLSKATGGKFFQTMDPEKIDEIYNRISRLINCHYSFKYTSPKPESKGKWRRLVVRAVKSNASATGKYRVNLPAEVTAITIPVNTLRLYDFTAHYVHIEPYDKDYIEVDYTTPGAAASLELFDMARDDKVFCIKQTLKGEKTEGQNFTGQQGSGAKSFKLIQGQKFFLTDIAVKEREFLFRVPKGCMIEIYGGSGGDYHIGDVAGKFRTNVNSSAKIRATSLLDVEAVMSGTSDLIIEYMQGDLFVICNDSNKVYVNSGSVNDLKGSVSGTGDLFVRVPVNTAELETDRCGDIEIEALSTRPRFLKQTGAGDIKFMSGTDWTSVFDDEDQKADSGLKLPGTERIIPPFPGDSSFIVDHSSTSLVPDIESTYDAIKDYTENDSDFDENDDDSDDLENYSMEDDF